MRQRQQAAKKYHSVSSLVTIPATLDNGADSTVMDNDGVSNWNYATDSRLTALSSLSIGAQNMVLLGLYNFLLAEKHHQQFIQCRC